MHFSRAIFLPAVLLSSHALADNPCNTIASDPARLACYDAKFGRPAVPAAPVAQEIAAAKPPPAAAQTPAPAAAVAATDKFGFTPSQLEQAQPAREPAKQQLTATVRQLEKRPTGEFIATLDNDQVWVQREIDSRARLKEGDTVTIRPAALGSYFLTTPDGVLVRVRRLE